MTKGIEKATQPEMDERTERILWRSLGRKSARQVSEETGIPPEAVLRWKQEVMSGIDEITINHRRMKLIVDLQDVSDKARDLADSAVQDFQAGLLSTSVSAMKTLLAELARLEKSDTSKIEALNQLRVQELLSLMAAVVESGAQEISEIHGIDEEELLGVFNRKLVEEAGKRDQL